MNFECALHILGHRTDSGIFEPVQISTLTIDNSKIRDIKFSFVPIIVYNYMNTSYWKMTFWGYVIPHYTGQNWEG